MSRILGLDMGTNSIGWAVRDTQAGTGLEQIIHKGSVIFDKGVGELKGKEFSLAAERTKHRSARRRSQRKRWRKIDLLSILIEHGMCPLSVDELARWKDPKRKATRKYPDSQEFKTWLRLDFDNNGVPDYANPYALRAEALIRRLSLQEIGRLAYHMNQRRGYLSNRSDKAQDAFDTEPDEEETSSRPVTSRRLGKIAGAIKELEDRLDGHTIGQKLHEAIKAGDRARRRTDEGTNISRLTLQAEFLKIAEFQLLPTQLTERIRRTIFDQRPLRSQKATVGHCVYEKDKSRCPISHPEYELYRMWQVLNNIKYSDDDRKTWHSLNPVERITIQKKFFRKSNPTFEFADIRKLFLRQHPHRIFNYNDAQTIAGCPTLAGLISIVGEERVWQMRKAALARLHWEAVEKRASPIAYPSKQLDLFDLWHWLFAMDNDKDQEIIRRKVQFSLGLTDREASQFVAIPLKPGYGNLSLKAIRKINHWLEQGERYDTAVFLANVPHLIGNSIWELTKTSLMSAVRQAIEGIGQEKASIDIANRLISQYNNLPYHHRFAKIEGYTLDEDDHKDINTALIGYFGEARWQEFPESLQYNYYERLQNLYSNALKNIGNGDLPYIKPPRLDENIKHAIYRITGLDPASHLLDKLYHPSDIESFAPAVIEVDNSSGRPTGRKLLNTPATNSIRNPMAMRTLYELRRLINYLIRKDIIDEHTQVMVEMARELNDANRRKAIERFQNERKEENVRFEQELKKIFQEQGRTLPADLSAYVERYRLREEQPKRVCMYTGRTISDADLFDENTTDIEHTLPRSLTFDDRMENKSIAYKSYNNTVKNKLFPSQLPNYATDTPEFTAIEPRLLNWESLVAEFEAKTEMAKRRSRLAATKEAKDKAIQDRHYYAMHHRYWMSKLERFTLTQVTQGFKNSQLVDTQLISKYGVLYLKTVFFNVRATKGLITDKIKRIWGAQGIGENKDRSNHAHHTIDAIIQTLLYKERNKPDIYNLLAEAYKEAQEHRWKEPRLSNPWGLEPAAFYNAMQRLAADTIVYHADRDNVLKQTKKKVRLKGKIEYRKNDDGSFLQDKQGEKIPFYQTGRGLRASLHKDTFYGAIKPPGKEVVQYRTSFQFRGSSVEDIRKNIPKIVDARLRKLAEEASATNIQKLGYFEIPPSEERKKRDAAAQPTKVFKVKIFADDLKNPIKLKRHAEATREHKAWYYVQTDGNYLVALYDNGREKDFELVNTFDLAGLAGERQGLYPLYKEKIFRGKTFRIPLSRRNGKDVVLRQGTKVLLYEESANEIYADPSPGNLTDRLFKVQGLSIQRIGGKYDYATIHLIHHLEAQPTSRLKVQDGEYKWGDGKKYRKMNHNQLRALIEGVDFHLTHVGTIIFINNVADE